MSKLIIFDLDGTVIDSIPDILENLNKSLTEFGCPKVTKEKCRAIIGHGARNLVKGALPENSSDVLVDKVLAYYNEIYTNSTSPKTAIYDGMEEVLDELRRRGYKLAVCTNKPQMTADSLGKGLLSGLFDMISGGEEGKALKPDPQAVIPLLKHFGATAEETYMVGDMTADLLTAANAGMISISVLWGYGNKEDLSCSGAYLFANSPKDLLKIIK